MKLVLRPRHAQACACACALVAFVYFAAYRVVHIGGCDSASYLAESFRLRGVDVGLAPDPRLPFRDAFLPICMVEEGGVIHSLFPPGFPVLLAMAGSIGLEFFVTPLFGAAGGLALFFFLRKHVFLLDDGNGCPEPSSAMRAELDVDIVPIATLPSNARLVQVKARR